MSDSCRENTLPYNPELSINCKRCTQVCPHGVFAEGPERAELVSRLPASITFALTSVPPSGTRLPPVGNQGPV